MDSFDNDVEFYHYIAVLGQEIEGYLRCVPTQEFFDEKRRLVGQHLQAADFKYYAGTGVETEEHKKDRLQMYLSSLQRVHTNAYQLYLESPWHET